MQTAVINIKYVNAPKGKGPASVKDDQGRYWKFWTRDIPLDRFAAGQSYSVGYKTEPYNGEDQYYIQAVMDSGAPARSAPAAAPAQTNGHTHAPSGNGNGNGQRDEFIFVCGALNHAIGAGKVEPVATELVPAILAFRDAYRQTFGSK